MKDQRINFPDYTAENQEQDAQKYKEKQKKDVYIVKVRGEYGAYIPQESLSVSFNNGKEFKDFIRVVQILCDRLKIKPRFRCIINRGIEDYVKQQIVIQKLLER